MKLSWSCRKNLGLFLMDIGFKKILNLGAVIVLSFVNITIVILRQPIQVSSTCILSKRRFASYNITFSRCGIDSHKRNYWLWGTCCSNFTVDEQSNLLGCWVVWTGELKTFEWAYCAHRQGKAVWEEWTKTSKNLDPRDESGPTRITQNFCKILKLNKV